MSLRLVCCCSCYRHWFVVGVTNGRERERSQVSGERSEWVLRARLLLGCAFVSCSCADLYRILMGRSVGDPLYGALCFPFYRSWESTGYSGGKGEEREKGRPLGSPGPSSPSCGFHRSCRCQQRRLHVAALFVTDTMHKRHLPVMASRPDERHGELTLLSAFVRGLGRTSLAHPTLFLM